MSNITLNTDPNPIPNPKSNPNPITVTSQLAECLYVGVRNRVRARDRG